jgi:hypothetical protein
MRSRLVVTWMMHTCIYLSIIRPFV